MPDTCVDYTHAIYPPKSIDIRRHLAAGARRLEGKLKALQLPDEPISPFIRAYFRSNIDHVQAAMQRYSFLLSWALRSRQAKGLEEVVLVDYGGGSGVLCLLAREIGIGTVIYVDIYDVCCRDAQSIGRRLNLEADHYVHADIEDLVAYLRKKELVCNTVMSYDALEHIYDIDHFFHHLQGITQGPLTLTLASGANPDLLT
jgi:2-polyprenyl-3-methyl-5-hydroxy-6-metoxy-1,4-benzoquinol methylase